MHFYPAINDSTFVMNHYVVMYLLLLRNAEQVFATS